MSKRFRFLLVVAILVVASIFLIPSFRWYFMTSREEKDLATSSREEIRDYAVNQAENELGKITAELSRENKDAPLPEDLLFLTDQQQFSSSEEKIIQAFLRFGCCCLPC